MGGNEKPETCRHRQGKAPPHLMRSECRRRRRRRRVG